MEIRQYLLLIKKWFWLLALGTLLGGAGAYVFSSFQPVVYEASSKIMVSRAQESENQIYTSYFDIQLAQTYAQIINTTPILDLLHDEIGYVVDKRQVTVEQIPNSQLIELTVTDNDPQKTADIANGLVTVFIEYNKNLQNDRFESIEESLQTQIKQIEDRIENLQLEMTQASESTFETERQQLEAQAREIEKLLAEADQEVIRIETQLEAFIPTPAVTNTPAPSWTIPTATPVPVPTPTLSSAAALQYKELQIRRDQLNEMRTLFQQAYGNLLVLGQDSGTDPALRQSQIQTMLGLYQQIYSGLLSNYESVRLARLRSTPSVVQVEAAITPTDPIQPQPVRNAMLGAIIGFMLVASTAFLKEYLDDTIKTPEDVHQHLGLAVVGMIGEMENKAGKNGKDTPGVYVAENPLSPIAEGYRTLRTNLDFAGVDQPIRSLLITSAGPGEGKSTTAVNLAAILAQGDRRVTLIDADMRKPAIHRYLGVANRKGLADLFRDGVTLANVTASWGEPAIDVIPSGVLPPNPAELLDSGRMGRILDQLKEQSHIVIADSPPGILADPIVLAGKMDGVLVVVKPGVTRVGAVQVLLEQLHRAGARVLGVVLNPLTKNRGHYYSKYDYYSKYYYKDGHYRQGTDRDARRNGSRSLVERLNRSNGKSSQADEKDRPREEI